MVNSRQGLNSLPISDLLSQNQNIETTNHHQTVRFGCEMSPIGHVAAHLMGPQLVVIQESC